MSYNEHSSPNLRALPSSGVRAAENRNMDPPRPTQPPVRTKHFVSPSDIDQAISGCSQSDVSSLPPPPCASGLWCQHRCWKDPIDCSARPSFVNCGQIGILPQTGQHRPLARCRRRVGRVLCWICLHLTIHDRYVIRYAGPQKSRIESRCLFRYSDPVSPHLAALREHGEENAPVNIFS